MRRKKAPIFKAYKVHVSCRLELGENIHKMRMKRKLSATALAKRINRTAATILDCERGRISPSILTLYLIAEGLQCSARKLMWDEGDNG